MKSQGPPKEFTEKPWISTAIFETLQNTTCCLGSRFWRKMPPLHPGQRHFSLYKPNYVQTNTWENETGIQSPHFFCRMIHWKQLEVHQYFCTGMCRCQVLPWRGRTCGGPSTSPGPGFRGHSSCTASLPRGIFPGRHKHLPGTARGCSLHAFSDPGKTEERCRK